MQQNTEKCAHCGKSLVRFNQNTPVVNRTDGETFHVGLFSGPYRREFASGDLHFEQVICNFSHVRGAGASVSEYLVLSILHAAKAEEALRGQIEAAADKLAEILVEGKKLGTSYTFQGDRLMEGLPP